jgi:four helix bundle protein
MRSYRDSDAWKTGHDLALAIYQATKPIEERDSGMTHRLRYAAIRGVGRIAFGLALESRKMSVYAVSSATGYFHEIGWLLSMVRTLELLPDEECDRLDALRGRVVFYTQKLIESLLTPPAADPG